MYAAHKYTEEPLELFNALLPNQYFPGEITQTRRVIVGRLYAASWSVLSCLQATPTGAPPPADTGVPNDGGCPEDEEDGPEQTRWEADVHKNRGIALVGALEHGTYIREHHAYLRPINSSINLGERFRCHSFSDLHMPDESTRRSRRE